MRLNIFKETPARLPVTRLKKMFAELSKTEKKPGWKGMVNLVFTDNKRIQSLNRQFRRIDEPTDVLAFGIDRPNDEDSVLGEVYVSVPTATKQARQAGVTLTEELTRLSCHGMLHLFGYDHERKSEAIQMKELEDYLVNLSGRVSDA